MLWMPWVSNHSSATLSLSRSSLFHTCNCGGEGRGGEERGGEGRGGGMENFFGRNRVDKRSRCMSQGVTSPCRLTCLLPSGPRDDGRLQVEPAALPGQDDPLLHLHHTRVQLLRHGHPLGWGEVRGQRSVIIEFKGQ